LVVSCNVSDHEPVAIAGGSHTIEMIDGGDPWFKLEIGSDPDEIENHDPIESDTDCMTLNVADPLFEIEIV